MKGETRVAIAQKVGLDTVVVDSALARVNAIVASGPKVLRNTVFIIPPRLSNAVKLKHRVVATVLIYRVNKNTSILITLIVLRGHFTNISIAKSFITHYCNRLMAFTRQLSKCVHLSHSSRVTD